MAKPSILNERIAIVALCFIANCALRAQNNGLSRTYYFDSIATVFTTVLPFEDGVVVVGQQGINNDGLSGFFVLYVDTLGEIRKVNVYKDPLFSDHTLVNSYYYNAVIRTPDKGILIAGNMFYRNSVFVVKVDSALNFEYFKEYDTEVLARNTRNIESANDFFFITGMVTTPDSDIAIFVMKLDIIGNILWERNYGHPSNVDNGSSALITDDGVLVLVGEWFDSTPNIYDDTESWTKFIRIDSSGEILSEWKSPKNIEAGSPNGLIKTSNGYCYFTRPAHQAGPGEIHFGTQIVCRDSLFNMIWKKDYSNLLAYQGFNDMTTDDEGNLYVTGQIYDNAMWGYVFKIDATNGDILWSARDTGLWRPGWGSKNIMEGIALLPGGSVIAVGSTYAGQGYDRGFLIKVTKDGCVDTLCTTATIEEYLSKSTSVKVYPNPASDHVVFEIPGDIHDNGSQAEIYDLNGRRMTYKLLNTGFKRIDFDSRYTSGIYAWRVLDRRGGLIGSGKIVIQN